LPREDERLALVLAAFDEEDRHVSAPARGPPSPRLEPFEERASDAHDRGTLLDRRFEVLGHAHGEVAESGKAEAKPVAKLAEPPEVRPRTVAFVGEGRHGHEALGR